MGYENSGRRPQSTALKVFRGNPGKRKPNPREPVPPAGNVQKPSGLSSAAGLAWDELAPICLAMGTLTTADVRVFGTLCELQATLQQASAQKDAKALATLRQEDTDVPEFTIVIDAVLKLERDTATAIRPYYALFGLEPVSRARLSVPKKADAPASKWSGLLK